MYCYSDVWSRLYGEVFGYKVHSLDLKIRGMTAGRFDFILLRSWIFGNRMISLPMTDCGGIYINDSNISEKDYACMIEQIMAHLDQKAKAYNIDIYRSAAQIPGLSG